MVEKIKWFEQAPGVTSSMRIVLMIGIVTGVTGFIFSMVLTVLTFIYGRWESIPIITTFLASSSGIMAIGDVAKGIQVRSEVKKNNEP
jgi:hypothetical protein